jgi:hypothetical protein
VLLEEGVEGGEQLGHDQDEPVFLLSFSLRFFLQIERRYLKLATFPVDR